MSTEGEQRATIVGTGLIGASVGLALRAQGWHVSGVDLSPRQVDAAIEIGACDAHGYDPASDLVVVATPVNGVVDAVNQALAECPHAAVTDVAGVKATVVAAIGSERYIGGHPMAGSEQIGLEGAHGGLFEGAAWVLCPGPQTSDRTYETVRSAVTQIGAEALTMEASVHDALVAVVSHVPHLTAVALVRLAGSGVAQHRALLRLAAGGFRDMTRIASGSPAIWPGVCAQNRDAILTTLDQLSTELATLRALIDQGDGVGLSDALTEAQQIRKNLPIRKVSDEARTELRVLIADRPGSVAAVAVLATELGINLESVSTIDVAEHVGGVVVLGVRRSDAPVLVSALTTAGFRVKVDTDE